ncbi:hypothetical protein BDV11DRAFT_171220 [Aspergillus similis]
MELQRLLAVLLACLVGLAAANPITVERDLSHKKEELLDILHEKWRGIYFTDAIEECSIQQFDTLVSALEVSVGKLMAPPDSDHMIRLDGIASFSGTPESNAHNSQYQGIINAMTQASAFPTKGKTRRWHLNSKASRVTLKCGPPAGDKNHCARDGRAAFTITAMRTEEGVADTIHFCDMYFDENLQTLNQKTNGPKSSNTGLTKLLTKEHILSHELFHCEYQIGLPFKSDTVQGFTGKMPIYGPEMCARFAWKYWKPGSRGKINEDTMNNDESCASDNYAWFYTYNWFHKHFGWSDKGDWKYIHDDLKRDVVGNDTTTTYSSTDIALDFEGESDTKVDSDDLDPSDIQPQANCHQVGNSSLDVECEYLGEDYEDWVDDHSDEVVASTGYTTSGAYIISTSVTSVTMTPSAVSPTPVACTPAFGAADPEGTQCSCSNGLIINRNPDGSCSLP